VRFIAWLACFICYCFSRCRPWVWVWVRHGVERGTTNTEKPCGLCGVRFLGAIVKRKLPLLAFFAV